MNIPAYNANPVIETEDTNTLTKSCPRCGEIKPIADFYKQNYGYQCYCKDCQREYSQERYRSIKDGSFPQSQIGAENPQPLSAIVPRLTPSQRLERLHLAQQILISETEEAWLAAEEQEQEYAERLEQMELRHRQELAELDKECERRLAEKDRKCQEEIENNAKPYFYKMTDDQIVEELVNLAPRLLTTALKRINPGYDTYFTDSDTGMTYKVVDEKPAEVYLH